jgi:hypothetical protein
MGKLFPDRSGQVVTLFAFAPALKTDSQRFLHPDKLLAKVPSRVLGTDRMLRRVTQPPHIAGPLAARQITACSHYTRTSNARARVLQPIPATVPSLQNTCFFAYQDFTV